jgi:hypothetical protein
VNKVEGALTRKAGPLPVWAWAALALVAGYVYLHRAPAATGGTQLPYTPSGTSAAQRPSSGQGTPADNGNSDLLDALGNNLAAGDALLAALQAGGQGGGSGITGSSTGAGASTGASSTDATTAPTIDSGTNNAPTSQAAIADPSPSPTITTTPPEGVYYVVPASDTQPQEYFQPSGYFQNEQGYARVDNTPDAVDRYLVSHGIDTSSSVQTTAVTQPTPTVVQPAPVDTSGVILTPRPTVGHSVAV